VSLDPFWKSSSLSGRGRTCGTFIADANYNPDHLALADATTSDTLTLAYDDIKVRALLNEIDGKNSLGTQTVSTFAGNTAPALMYMNFQGVSVAQKDFTLGGINVDPFGTETASQELLLALSHTDASIGKLVAELRTTGQLDSTLIIVTAKHGQNARLGTDINVHDSSITDALTNASMPINNFAVQDDVALIWLTDQTQTPAAVNILRNLQASGTHPEIDRILSGHSVIQVNGFGDPTKASDTRTPDIVIQVKPGYVYDGFSGFNVNKLKRAEHGGFVEDDTHVPLIVASGNLGVGLNGSVQSTPPVR
jgi:predicted AlkP superfamily pyrophosphatase or phosphodiesterase